MSKVHGQETRLRVFDVNTPWFWFTIFYHPVIYGQSWFRIELWEAHRRDGKAWWWFNLWQWEEVEHMRGQEVSECRPKNASPNA